MIKINIEKLQNWVIQMKMISICNNIKNIIYNILYDESRSNSSKRRFHAFKR